MAVVMGGLRPLGYQRLTSMTASTALTVPTGAVKAFLMPETASVRMRDDGTAPTTTNGLILSNGHPGMMYEGDLAAVRFINGAASNGAILHVLYYGVA